MPIGSATPNANGPFGTSSVRNAGSNAHSTSGEFCPKINLELALRPRVTSERCSANSVFPSPHSNSDINF
jgi:hypothetical protein